MVDSALISGLVIKPFKSAELNAAQEWVLADTQASSRIGKPDSVDIEVEEDVIVLKVAGRPSRDLLESRINNIGGAIEGVAICAFWATIQI